MYRLVGLLTLLISVVSVGMVEAGGCYRPFVGHVGHGYGYYQPYYYYPQVIEVQVTKDRYYSLSDLYRDRLYLEAFDMMREMRQRLANIDPNYQAPAVPQQPSPPVAQAPVPNQVVKGVGAKPGDKAAKILAANCVSCHGKGDTKIDLSNPEAVSVTKRWASFGLMASGDMPQPPLELRQKGKEKELQEWKQKNALKEDELETLYKEWVIPAAQAKR